MLNNLKAEFVRLGIEPHIGVAEALECSQKVARNRLNGFTEVTVGEAKKIKKRFFPKLSIDYLFAEDDIQENNVNVKT